MFPLDVVLLQEPDLDRLEQRRDRDADDKDSRERPVQLYLSVMIARAAAGSRDAPVDCRKVAVVGGRQDDERARAEDTEDAGADVSPAVARAQRAGNAAEVSEPAFGEESERICARARIAVSRGSSRRLYGRSSQKMAVRAEPRIKSHWCSARGQERQHGAVERGGRATAETNRHRCLKRIGWSRR